jgi:2-methylisocitrate lyase-like PEP mutase family enzyme
MNAIERFCQLHQSGCFVLPNPWDAGSAVILHRLGFAALASSSAGFAFTRGRPDHPKALPVAAVLAHLSDLVQATPLPVNADFQSGYADDLETLSANVRACVATGVAGLSIEDATGDPEMPLFPLPIAVERLRAARAAIGESGVVLTARCEAYLVGVPDVERVAFERLTAFAEIADCLYAPGVRDLDVIARMVKHVAPKPLNVLAAARQALPIPTVAELAGAGVRRISVGSALARVALGAFLRTAKAMAERGEFDFAGMASFAELNELFS